MDEWVAWDRRVLYPAALNTSAPDALAAALEHVSGLLEGDFLVGGKLTLADVVVYCTLLPLVGFLVSTGKAWKRPYANPSRCQ